MANVILGLLLLAPMSLYDLIKAFEQGISLFYSASSGSIKRALDGLLKKGYIVVADVQPGARGRKTYAITDEGRAAFRAWMLAPVDETDLDAAALARIRALGHLTPDERVIVLQHIRARVARDLAALEEIGAAAQNAPVPDELRSHARYGLATLDYGLMSHRATLEWLDDFLRDEHRQA